MGVSGKDAPMRIAAAAAVAAILALPTVVSAAAPSDRAAVRSVLLRQATLVKQGKWRQMYNATYTARFRARCPYARFVRNGRQVRAILGPNFRVDRIQIRVRPGGRQAVAAYRFVRNGRPLVSVRFSDGDVYAKIGNRWFDEHDRVSAC
jgi:hypothetical protein